MVEILLEYKTVITILHLFGVIIGFGAAIVADYLFFRFVANFKLSNGEIYVMGLVSLLVWVGLSLIILSGFALFFSDPATYLQSTKFLLKMFVVGVITVNGTFLHFFIKPKLKTIDWKSAVNDNRRKVRKLAFAAGAISFSSWFIAMVLGSIKSIPLDLAPAVSVYLGLILLIILSSQLAESLYTRYFTS